VTSIAPICLHGIPQSSSIMALRAALNSVMGP
jgi:hypothetical protein